MLKVFRQRRYRIVFAANVVSLFGSGLSHAGIIWYVLQQTQSEKSVALLVALMTMPSLLFLPFTGVLIDRVDRRHLSITLDVTRCVVLTAAAASAWAGTLETWQVYAVGTFLGVGAFIYWPNLAALLQELITDPKDAVPVNALLMGAAQSGWMLAGTVVGFIYGSWGIAGVLTIDALSYVVSATLFSRLRRGKYLGYRKHHESETVGGYLHELAGGVRYALANHPVLLIGAASALFQAAMMSQNVLTAPLNEKILRSGAIGFGWCNAGWSLGAILASGAAGAAFRRAGLANRAMWMALASTGVACILLPFSGTLAVAVALYVIMGGGRGMAGVSVSTAIMHEVPPHVMGRTQNLITFAGIVLQLVMTFGVGWLSENIHLAAGFLLVGGSYLAGSTFAYGLRNHAPALPTISAAAEPVAVAHEDL